LYKRQLTEADYWIAINKKVGMERLIHEGTPVLLEAEGEYRCFMI